MAIEILTMSAECYCKMYRKKLSNYECKGVHSHVQDEEIKTVPEEQTLAIIRATQKRGLDQLIENCPENTEVITDFRENYSCSTSSFRGGYIASATALIPKNKQHDGWFFS